jgi:invasion protein IalB
MSLLRRKTVMIVISALPVALMAQTSAPVSAPVAPTRAPVLAEVSTHQNWIVACDNSLTCEASSLQPEDADMARTPMLVSLIISAPPTASAKMAIMLDVMPPKKPLVLGVAGTDVVVHKFATAADFDASFTLDAKAMKALSLGNELILEDADGVDFATASLAGFRDVLLRAQTAQRGTANVPIVTRLPMANVPKSPPMEPTPKEVMGLRKQSGCTLSKGEWQDKIVAPLDKTTSLILLSCGAGAYNYSYVPYVGKIEGGKRSFALAGFDLAPDWGDTGSAMLVNPSWDILKARLSSYAKGRGLGDCGSAQDWVWTGARFTLVEAHEMPDCRGSLAWPTVWRADVRAPADPVAIKP